MAIVLVDHNACFLHFPKTGGMWIEKALENAGIKTEVAKHSFGVDWRHAAKDMLTGEYNKYFAFVRHPFSWYESWWKYYYSSEGCERARWSVQESRVWHPLHSLRPLMSPDFNEFIYNVLDQNPSHLRWMYELYVGPAGNESVDYVGRQENLVNDLIAILNEIGVEYDPHVIKSTPAFNQSVCMFEKPKWDASLQKALAEKERECIKRFYRKDTEHNVIR